MAAMRDLVARARAGTLRASEMSDPTVTVTSLGDQGTDSAFGIIYPPQVAIVGFGTPRERPWAEGGMLAVRTVLTATLSADATCVFCKCRSWDGVELPPMVQAAPSHVSYEDFLEAEQRSATKHEWLDGVIYAMAGGTLEHSRLASNMNTALKTAHSRCERCEVFQADAMIFVRATQLSTYADATVVCGPVESQKVERNGRLLGEALLNPTVIVEVLSDSTEDYDRGEKFAHYMRIPSLKEYVLVSQDAAKIEVFRRPERGHWSHEEASAGESVQILGCAIGVDDIYRRAVPA